MSGYAVYFSGPVPYAQATLIQEALLEARIADRIPDTVLFLQHPPVVTLGNRGRRQHLLLSEEALSARGIELAHAARGGDVTYHAPGQLVIYPIIKLGSHEADSHGYLWNLEEVAIRTAADFGVAAHRRKGKNGAWTSAGKIAAIGFRLKRWVAYHGMSFNVNPDLAGFQVIVPCGLVGEAVASLETLLGEQTPAMHKVRERMAHHFETICGRKLEKLEAAGEPPGKLLERLADRAAH